MTFEEMPPDEQQAPGAALRVGVVLDLRQVLAWQAWIIDDLATADFVELSVFASPDEKRLAGAEPSWLFAKYAEWDAKRTSSEEDPLRPVDLSGRLNGLGGERLQAPLSLAEIPGASFDVILWLLRSEPNAETCAAARYGLWRYRTQPPEYFWEVYKGSPVTRLALEAVAPDGGSRRPPYEGFSATVQGWSWRGNQAPASARASLFPLRCLRALRDQLQAGAAPPSFVSAPSSESPAIARQPTSLEVARFCLRNAIRTVNRRVRYAGQESYWYVAYRSNPRQFIANTEQLDMTGFAPVSAPAGHFYADPFVIEWGEKNLLFVEDYLFAEARGCISVAEISSGGVGPFERVLDLPYHLSYPFVFEHEGHFYMLPETLGANRIELFRAADTPSRWERVHVFQDNVQAVDTTLWVEDGLFYFFTNFAGRGATVNDELYLFYAHDLFGRWHAHPQNPIVTDVRRSRGAGKLFRRQGRLLRPSQDCSVRYGYACQLNEIEILTTREYREKPLLRIEPDWAPALIGTHTLNSNSSFEVVDGQIYRKRRMPR